MRIKVSSLIDIFKKLDEFEKQSGSKDFNFSFLECEKLIPGIKNVAVTVEKFINIIIVFCSINKKDFDSFYKKPFLYYIHRYNLEKEENLNLDLIRVESDSFDQGSEIKLESDNEEPLFKNKKFSFDSENFSSDSLNINSDLKTNGTFKLKKGENQKTKKYLDKLQQKKFLIQQKNISKEKLITSKKKSNRKIFENNIKKICKQNSRQKQSPSKDLERSNSQKKLNVRRDRFLTQKSNFSADKEAISYNTNKEGFFFVKKKEDFPLKTNNFFEKNIFFKKQFSQKDKLQSTKRKANNKSALKYKKKKLNNNHKSLIKKKKLKSKSKSKNVSHIAKKKKNNPIVSSSTIYSQFFPMKMNSNRRSQQQMFSRKKANQKKKEKKEPKESLKLNYKMEPNIYNSNAKLNNCQTLQQQKNLNWFEPVIKYNFIYFLDNLLKEKPEFNNNNLLLSLEQEIQKLQDQKILNFDVDNKTNEFLETFQINNFENFSEFLFNFCQKNNILLTKSQITNITRSSVSN